MTWACPACRTAIQHHEDVPRPNIVYRCHICRLELVTDAASGKMAVAPLQSGQQNDENSTNQKPTR